MVLALGCSDRTPDETPQTVHAALSLGDASILGCETGWTKESGGGVLSFDSAEFVQGQKSLKLANTQSQYTLLKSEQIGLIDAAPTSFSVRFRLSEDVSWGTIGVNLDWNWIPADAYIPLANVTHGEWQTATFPIPQALASQLVGRTNVIVRVGVNLPNGAINFDEMKFDVPGGTGSGGAGSGGASGGTGGVSTGGTAGSGAGGTGSAGSAGAPPANLSEMVIRVPKQTTFNKVALGAQGEQLDIHNAVMVFSGKRNLTGC